MTISVPLAQTVTQSRVSARLDSTYPYASCYIGQLIYKHPLAVSELKIEKEEIPLSPKILDIGVKKRS